MKGTRLAAHKVYFDNAATTKVHPKVLEKILPYLKEDFGNPSSIHSFGRKTRNAIEEAREVIASSINADASEIYFVSGGTEANNFALFGISRTEFIESKRNRIVSTKAEHQCILESLNELGRNGFDIALTELNNDSSVKKETLLEYLTDQASLISIIHANNETGTLNDIKSFAEICRVKNILIHSDAVQSFGKIKIDVVELGVNALSFSSHKINGPKGAGAVYCKSGTPLSPIIFGGSQERNRRGGTENIPDIIGFAEAVKIAEHEMVDNYNHVKRLRDHFAAGIMDIDSAGICINGGQNTIPHILSITFMSEFYKNDAEAMLIYLDLNGIAASNGAACTSGTIKPSHVILNMGRSISDSNGTIRFSFGADNTIEEVDYALEVLKKMSTKFSV